MLSNTNPISSSALLTAVLAFGFAMPAAAQTKLTVRSTNIDGVAITVSPADTYGRSNGRTSLTRFYRSTTGYTLTAPRTISAGGHLARFHHWELLDQPGGQWIKKPLLENTLTVNRIGLLDDVAVAHYVYQIQVSVRAIGTTPIQVRMNKADLWGNKDGTTQFTRFLEPRADDVSFTAPTMHQGRRFYRWRINTDLQPIGQTTITPAFTTRNATITAQYGRYVTPAHATFGTGCVGTNGRVEMRGRFNPAIDRFVRYQLVRGPVTSAAVLTLGSSATRWGSIPLPMSLGGTSCMLRTDPAFFLRLTTSPSGLGEVSFKIPNEQALVGQFYFTQFLCIDLPANSFGLTASNAMRGTIGGWDLR